jgi:hypothetical protein
MGESGGVQDERVHGSAQATEDAKDGDRWSAMAGAAVDRGLDGGPGAVGDAERWSEGERHGGVEDEGVRGSAEAAERGNAGVKGRVVRVRSAMSRTSESTAARRLLKGGMLE